MREPSSAKQSSPQARAVGRYELGREIAHGGMGVILHARDRFTRREVAYKRLLVRDERARARVTALFQREYDTLARLPHPNIVEVYDYGVDADGPYYTMELLTGRDLTQVAPLPYREACRIVRDVASALALLHARRLIHRDVSPSNVRLTADGRAKLIDFGALIPFGRPKELVGTPACIAPECLSDRELDHRIDLYSLGAVAYWTLTRRAPVRARQIDELPAAWEEPLLAPSVHVSELPPELDELVLSLLARDPLARPSSAAYLIERLTTIADLAPESDERRVAYSYLAHPPLVGRKELRETLVAAVEGALEAKGRTLLIEAAAGLGRSALLDEVAVRGQWQGATVLRADGEGGLSAFSIARKLVQSALTLYPDLQDRDGLNSSRPDVNKLQTVRSPLEVAERHARVVASVQETLFECAKRAPVLLVIDDLHAVDDESLSLLASLAQGLGGRKFAIVASSVPGRSEERSPAYTNFENSAVRFSLGSLNDQEVVELVNYVFGGVPNSLRLAQWLKEQSGGNPGTAMDLSRLLLQRNAIRYTLGTFTLPHDASTDLSQDELARVNLARLGDLSEQARQSAAVLSVHDAPLSVLELGHVLDTSKEEVALALRELLERSVAMSTESGVSLSSASLSAALKRTLAADEKRRLHERLGHAILACGDGSSESQLAASTHLLAGGCEKEAAALVTALSATRSLEGQLAARWGATLEAVLAIYRKQGRRKEECLSLMIPLVHAGFYGDVAAQRRHTETALEWMSLICGMTLARKLRPYLGGKLALVLGLIYASLRRASTPSAYRIGSIKDMLSQFVALAGASTASAASSFDGATALRYTTWLEPFTALPKDHPAALMREFSLATAEIVGGEFESASSRFTRLMPILLSPVEGIDEHTRNTFYRGCLNGRAQAEVANGSAKVLELAEKLAEDPFFAPHAECARMTYYGYRGERDLAEVHRARAELSALRGGTSWSAITVLTVRMTYMAIFSQDAIALLQAINELERFSAIAPKLRGIKAIAEAWLEHLRGKPERAIALFERVLHTDDARHYPSWRVDRTLYATALNAAGRHSRAREICVELLGDPPDESNTPMRPALPQLALAEAGLGQHGAAAALMDRYIALVQPSNNALLLGNGHRDRARIAMLAGDEVAYEHHFAEMKRYYRATQNPSLIRQIEASAGDAQRSGLSVSSGRIMRKSGGTALPDDDLDSTTVVDELETKDRITLVAR